MANIQEITVGSLAKSNKVNELIKKVNALENMLVRVTISDEASKLVVSENSSELVIAVKDQTA